MVMHAIQQTSTAHETSVAASAASGIRYFTKRAVDEKAKSILRRRELSLKNMSASHRYFDKKTQADQVQRDARTNELLGAPRSAAVEYFEKVHQGKKAEMEETTHQPASVAAEHFNTRAKDEREMKGKSLADVTHDTQEPSFATQDFAQQWARK